MNMNKFVMLGAIASMAVCTAEAKVTLATPFKDKMVLQRQMEVPVWGWAEPGEKVAVGFDGVGVSTTADADGRWMVKLPAMEASKEGRVLSANEAKVFDVLVGEVWFCAGQSNTELPLVGDNPHFSDREGRLTAQLTNEPEIRFAYCSNYRWSTAPKAIYEGEFGAWQEFTPENLGRGHSFSAMGVYYALQLHEALDIPIGIIGTYWGGTNIDAWTPREGYENISENLRATAEYEVVEADGWNDTKRIPPIWDPWQQPTVLFNEMVAPWTPFAIRGFIWYQGCHNAAEGALYCDKMHALYNGWSKVFENPALKLYFVQLAPWSTSWWDVELAQEKFADEEPNAGMVVTVDVGNSADIHPNEKGIIGRRLAALAMKRDYGFTGVVADYPRVVAGERDGSQIVLRCANVVSWYVYNPDWGVEVPFEICGADGVWHKARLANANDGATQKQDWVTIGRVAGAELRVVADEVAEPVAVRYLHEAPWMGNVFADSGLPLAAFEFHLN